MGSWGCMMRRMQRTARAALPYGVALTPGSGLELRSRRLPALSMAAAVACIAALSLTAFPTPTPPSDSPAAGRVAQGRLATTLPIELAPAASASIGASEHSFWAVRRGASLLTNGGGIRSAFDASGARLSVAEGTLSLSLASVARGRRIARARTVAPSGAASQVLYNRGAISEFYRNGPYGLEQGFTLRRRVQGGAGSLVLALSVAGSLVPKRAGSQILFRTQAGATALRYGQLSAVDAAGRQLPAHMEIRGVMLQLRIDDTSARYPLQIDPFFQQGAKLTGSGVSGKALLGESVALSADGNTAVIGGPSDNSGAGAAWVFTRSGSTWSQQGPKLLGSQETGKGHFGNDVALSDDGTTAMIGGPGDSSSVGAAWVFTRSGSTWEPQGPKLTGGGEIGTGRFGFRVALSGDGASALIGGPGDSANAGAAWVFTRSGSTWEQLSKLSGSGEIGKGEFGVSVALSGDGNTGLVGGGGDNGERGAAWVFARSGAAWEQQGPKLTGGDEVGNGRFGFRVALSEDGNTGLIGGGSDDGEIGAAWAFTRSGSTWEQQGPKLTGGGEVGKGHLGYSLALSADGDTALIGGLADNNEIGAAWVFTRSGSTWEQQGPKLTGGGEVGKGLFGYSVALSADASTALVGGGADNGEVGAAWAFRSSAGAPPTVTTVSPTSGTTAGGTKVTIKGSGFLSGATVTIGTAATAVNVVSPTEITATTAATAAGPDEVIVTDANGTSAGGPSYTYVAPPPPKVTSITPTSGTSAGGTKVTIKGSGFVAGATVTIGNAATAVTVVSAIKITAVTSATAAGPDEVIVTDANGTSTGGPSYTYVAPPPPSVTSITPTSGPTAGGTTVTIKGTNLTGSAPVVDFGSTVAPNITSATATKIVVVSPQVFAGGTVDVTVTTAGGTSPVSPSDRFTYIAPPPPKVTSITPTSGTTEGGTPVTINGSGFVSGATVTIGTAASAVNVV
ncbi:MAG: hypothetical protein QOG40_953, partial [Solirubrobacteraceae bacterium]|nr:hypothetical protein [Solirubrobacteraceae bacterium]